MVNSLPYRLLETTVSAVEDMNVNMRRVTLTCDEFADFRCDRPGQWVKLFFSEDGPGRAYTIRRWRPHVREMDIDFFRHEGGVAASWVERVEPGIAVWLAGPRSDFTVTKDRNLILVGDETALPAICAIVESLADRSLATVIAKVADPRSIEGMPELDGANVKVVVSPTEGADAEKRVLSCVEGLCRNPEGTCIWAGCESGLARLLRLQCQRQGLDRPSIHISGYWKRGVVEHMDPTSDY